MRYFILISGLILFLSAAVSETAYGGWEGPVMISDGTGGWYYPRVEVSRNYVHVVWRDIGETSIKYRRSTDGGTTWNPIQTLNSGNAHDPTIAVSEPGYVHVVWYSGPSAIKYRRSTDNGATFGTEVTLPTGGQGDGDPQIAADGNYVYVAWFSGIPYDILFMESTDNGVNWGSVINVSNDGSAVWEYNVRLAAWTSTVHLAWMTVSAPNVNAYYRHRLFAGWTAPMTLWTTPIDSFNYIAISAEHANVYVDRDDATGGPAQRVSTSSGTWWGGTTMLGGGTGRQPRVDGSSAYTGNACNVYIRGSGLYVSTGAGTETQIGTVGGSSPSADIAANPCGEMHVVCNSRNADYEIYYYRYRTCNPGDADNSGSIDIDDVVYLISYIFSGGPAPAPYAICSGDPDCSCAVDIDDVVYLISFIFSGGPPPCSCTDWVGSCGLPLRVAFGGDGTGSAHTNSCGKATASGVHFYHIEPGDFRDSKEISLLK